MSNNGLDDVRQLVLNNQIADALTMVQQRHIDYHGQAIKAHKAE